MFIALFGNAYDAREVHSAMAFATYSELHTALLHAGYRLVPRKREEDRANYVHTTSGEWCRVLSAETEVPQ